MRSLVIYIGWRVFTFDSTVREGVIWAWSWYTAWATFTQSTFFARYIKENRYLLITVHDNHIYKHVLETICTAFTQKLFLNPLRWRWNSSTDVVHDRTVWTWLIIRSKWKKRIDVFVLDVPTGSLINKLQFKLQYDENLIRWLCDYGTSLLYEYLRTRMVQNVNYHLGENVIRFQYGPRRELNQCLNSKRVKHATNWGVKYAFLQYQRDAKLILYVVL